jgi:hypothetical protein
MAAPSGVSSTTTGIRKGTPSAIRWVRSTASFHSSRKYPSPRACVRAEMIGMKSAQSLICLRICLVPDIPAAQLALVEPNLDPLASQGVRDALGRRRSPRGHS